MEKRRNIEGFSLVELIVVIAIIVVLLSLLVPSVLGYIEKANNVADASDAKEILSVLQMEVLLSDDYLIPTDNAYKGKSHYGYVYVNQSSVRVSTKEVGDILAEAGFVNSATCRKYQAGSMTGYEYQFWSESTTINNSGNKGYWGKKNENIKQSAGTRCHSQSLWTRYEIVWKNVNGSIRFYCIATDSKSTNVKANKTLETSKKLGQMCGMEAYTGSDIDIY